MERIQSLYSTYKISTVVTQLCLYYNTNMSSLPSRWSLAVWWHQMDQ